MELNIFKTDLVHTLYKNIEANLELYENGNFDELLTKSSQHIVPYKEATVDETVFSQLEVKAGGANDAKNAFLIYNAFENLNPYLAIDERMWVALTHQHAKDFVTQRWLKKGLSKKKKISAIKDHFFARGNRAIERKNALSSLWWWAYLVARTNPDNHAAAIELFCKYTDLRANVLERNSTSRGHIAFEAILKCIEKKYSDDPDTNFFKRKKAKGKSFGPYRVWLMKINRFGGRKFMEAFTVKQLSEIYYSFLEEVEQSISAP